MSLMGIVSGFNSFILDFVFVQRVDISLNNCEGVVGSIFEKLRNVFVVVLFVIQ